MTAARRCAELAAGRRFAALANFEFARRGLRRREVAALTRELSIMLGADGAASGQLSRLYVGMVRAGGAGGSLALTLERLSLLLERKRSLVVSIQSAMIYPTLLVVAAIGSVHAMLDAMAEWMGAVSAVAEQPNLAAPPSVMPSEPAA